MTGYSVKVAELTIGDANIGCVYVPVYLPRHFSMRHLLFAKFIGYIHQVGKWCVFKKKHAFFYRKKLELKGFAIEIL
jgi:hypothetical protein